MAAMDVHTARRTEKPWGYELLWAITERYAAKILHVRAGQRLSRQLHLAKDEYQYVLSGQVVLEVGEGGTMRRVHLSAGEGMHIPTGMVHRVCAITDADVLEASTPELDDVVRIEDDYGRSQAVQALTAGS